MKETWPKKVATALKLKSGRIVKSRSQLLNGYEDGNLPSHLELCESRRIDFALIAETGFIVNGEFEDGGGGSLEC